MTKNSSALSVRIKELRESEGLTQQAFAKEFKISKQTVSNYENAERTPDVDLLLAISNRFNVSMDYLTGNSEMKNQGLVPLNKKLQKLNDFIELYSEVKYFTKQNIIDALNDFLDLVLRHVTNTEILCSYADILKLINIYDLALAEEYSSPRVLEGVDIVKHVDGMTVSYKANSVSEKELDTAHNILKKLINVNNDYLMEKCQSLYAPSRPE